MYQQGIRYNDITSAVNGLQGYIAIDNSVHYKDTLSMLYFSSSSYYPSLLLSQEVHREMPENYRALARVAECYRNLGESKKAIEAYEKI